MKWYWAILQTLGIITLLCLIELIAPIPPRLATGIIAFFGIWAAADSSSFGWGLFVFLLWPIAYPWYLIVRYNVRQESRHVT